LGRRLAPRVRENAAASTRFRCDIAQPIDQLLHLPLSFLVLSSLRHELLGAKQAAKSTTRACAQPLTERAACIGRAHQTTAKPHGRSNEWVLQMPRQVFQKPAEASCWGTRTTRSADSRRRYTGRCGESRG
jgi:hypothetical protein